MHGGGMIETIETLRLRNIGSRRADGEFAEPAL
jgi:hypothetical protein